MWRSARRTAIAFIVVSAGVLTQAAAEPLQIVYRIDIAKRCVFASNDTVCEAFEASFPVTLTFDSGVTVEHGNDLDRTRFYGTPTLSEIPLPRRTDFPPVTLNLAQTAERARFSAEDSGWIREANVVVRHRASEGGNDYSRDLSFIANGLFPSPPDLNARSFAAFLASGAFRQFSVSDSVELASGGFESLSYTGSVTLESGAAVTPEPASLLLLGSGLAVLARRRALRQR